MVYLFSYLFSHPELLSKVYADYVEVVTQRTISAHVHFH